MWVKKTPNKWQNILEIVVVILLMVTYGLLVGAIANELRPVPQ